MTIAPSAWMNLQRGCFAGLFLVAGTCLIPTTIESWYNDRKPLTPALSPSEGAREVIRAREGSQPFYQLSTALGITNDGLRAGDSLERQNPPAAAPEKPGNGPVLVNCFYRLANPVTLAMQCEAVAINADFWSQVLQSCSLKPMDFSLGAAMVTRRAEIAAMGGFAAFRDCLADDYQIGNRIVRQDSGKRIKICPVVVECWDGTMGWPAVWKHQLRWARTIRVCQPVPYFFSILSNPTVWPLAWAVAAHNPPAGIFLGLALVARMLMTADLQRRLRAKTESRKLKAESEGWWLAPVKDVLQVVVWAAAFMGNTVEWRGRRMKVKRDGTLVEA